YNLIINKRSPLSAFANLSFVSFALLPLVSVRFLPYMSIVSILPLAAAFDSLSSYFKFKLNLRPLKGSWTFSVCFLALAALLLYKHHGYGPSPLLYPYGC